MFTLEEIRNEVILALQEEDISSDLIDAKINEGLLYCSRKITLSDLESTGTFDTEVGTDIVPIPEEWDYQKRLHAASSFEQGKIEVVTSINLLRAKYPIRMSGPDYGDVKIITTRKGNIVYYPIPETVQTITCKFYEKPSPLVKESDIPECLPEGTEKDLLKNYALWKFFEVIEDGILGAKINTKYYKGEFLEALGESDDLIDEGQSSVDPVRESSWI